MAIKRDADIPSMPGHLPMPPSKSIKPYLTYELDVIRKEEKRIGYSRNMNQFAQAMKDARRSYKISQRDIGLQGLHLCNRYCGGSHTITTPHQRVTRIGHFMQQWGPEAFPYPKEEAITKKVNYYPFLNIYVIRDLTYFRYKYLKYRYKIQNIIRSFILYLKYIF